MKKIAILMASVALAACQTLPKINRTYHASYEAQLGYTQVVQFGNELHLSGVVSDGPTMEAAVNEVYEKIGEILQKHNLTFADVIKENLFTTDMKAMRKQVETRKKFYPENTYPASSWVEVKGLFMPEFILEVELTARIP